MKELNVLDGLPQLIHGAGPDPEHGGCIMQVVNYLWNKGWDDQPICVLDVLKGVSISVNDHSSPEDRQQLWRLIPRLMGTNPLVKEKELWIDNFGVIHTSEYDVSDEEKARPLNEHMMNWLNDHNNQQTNGIKFLEAALDEYDRFTGRKASSCKSFDESYVKEIKETLPKEAFSVSSR